MTISELIKQLQQIPNPDTTQVYHFDEYCAIKTTEIETNPDNKSTTLPKWSFITLTKFIVLHYNCDKE